MNVQDCFDKDDANAIRDIADQVYSEIRKLRREPIKQFPVDIECLTDEEIDYYWKKHGAGHGLYLRDQNLIKINPYMSKLGILLNFVHENLHHGLPELAEKPVDILTTYVGCQVGLGNSQLCQHLEALR
jgi:hypothetical protein